MFLEIIEFIKNNPDWEERLASSPCFVKTKRQGNFALLKYNQIYSNFNLPLVRECRGIILDCDNDIRPLCVPFFKFGNFGESYIPEIDWNTARVQEKVDGSLIKLWHYNDEWHISSNGEIDARNAHINSALLTGRPQSNLHDLFMEAWYKTGVQMDDLDKDNTYMFELTSPHNRVVVRYGDSSIRHVGTRNNQTLMECDMDIGVSKPKTFPLGTLDECIESAKLLGDDEEGYVIVDQYFNRIKVKSPRYVALNHKVQGVTTQSDVVEIIQNNEQDEFLNYFPEYREVFNDILRRIEEFSARQDEVLRELLAISPDSRKTLAEAVQKTDCPACLFALIDKKEPNARSWLISRPAAKILMYIGKIKI